MFCVDRRQFLRVGGLSVGSLSLPGFWPSSVSAKPSDALVTDKAVIFLFMQGGPSQFETFDPKPDLPDEKGGVGGAMQTSVPGLYFGASMARLARHAHKLAIVRSFTTPGKHGGKEPIVSKATNDISIGTIYHRVAGSNHPRTGLPQSTVLWPKAIVPETNGSNRFGGFDASGSLGKGFAPFKPGGEGAFARNMRLSISPDRLTDRRSLLKTLDQFQRDRFDASPVGLEGLQRQAYDMLIKGVAGAFDLSQEDEKLAARYDTSHFYKPELWGKKNNGPRYTGHTKTLGKLLLLARRLCEAGCGFVTVCSDFVWDMHSDKNNLELKRGMQVVGLPFDHAVSALIEDIEARGLSDKIMLVCCGEMGRSPGLNKTGGRGHWGRLAPLIVYGGGLTHGQVIGESNRDGGTPKSSPLKPDNLLSTIFHQLFHFGQVRLDSSLPAEVLQIMDRLENMPGVLS